MGAVQQDPEVAQLGGRDARDPAADLVVVGGLLAVGREVDDADVFANRRLSAQLAETAAGCAQDRQALRDQAGVLIPSASTSAAPGRPATMAPSVSASMPVALAPRPGRQRLVDDDHATQHSLGRLATGHCRTTRGEPTASSLPRPRVHLHIVRARARAPGGRRDPRLPRRRRARGAARQDAGT
jgi:hypothetical protein